ncbi:hypothetical protein [Longimicrobium sp.]|uniref:hypothetical protein n=1 Tax=Longimicrobium sp. TaxID=2029185 RepID=UPI003B3B237D
MSTHDDGMDEEMTPELRSQLSALARERDPGRLLEERTVGALRDRGLIEAPKAGGRIRRIPRAWLGGAVAAGIALFATGITVGQWMGTRATAQVVQAVQAQNERQAALLVQQTGSAYVDALGQMAALSDSGKATPVEGREVATRILRAAADELVRIAPDDPIAGAVLAGFQRADSAQAAGAGQKQRVVWF